MSLPLVPLKICARRLTVSALVAALPEPGVSTLCSTCLVLIGVAPRVTLGAVLRSTAPVAETALRATDAAAAVVAEPLVPVELDPQAATVVSPRAAIRAAAVRAAGRLGRTGKDFRSGRAGVEVPQGKA